MIFYPVQQHLAVPYKIPTSVVIHVAMVEPTTADVPSPVPNMGIHFAPGLAVVGRAMTEAGVALLTHLAVVCITIAKYL